MHAKPTKELKMNINSVSSANFSARISDKDYYYGKIQDDLYTNHGVGAEEILEFERELEKLPAGDVVIDEYVKHGGRDYIFGDVYPPCEHKKSFMLETSDSENLLEYLLDKIKMTFREKSKHLECPICNP